MKKTKKKGLASEAKDAAGAEAEAAAVVATERAAASPDAKKPAPEPKLSLAEQRVKARAEMFAAVNKKYGKGAIGTGKTIERRAVQRLSTGSFRLDFALGGGWARGRMNLIWGERSSAKTTDMLKTAGLAQKTDALTGKFVWEVENPLPMVVQWIDVEGAFDRLWAEAHGVDVDALILSRPETGEQTADMVEAALSSGAVDVVVIDSLAAMVPQAELEGAMEDNSIGVAARLNSKMFRKVQARINEAARSEHALMPTLLVINQLRTKIGVMFGDPSVKPGGVAQDFYSSIEVRKTASKIEHFDAETKMLPRCGTFKFVVIKNKLSPPRVNGEYVMMLADDPKDERLRAGTIDEVKEVMAAAERLGVYLPPHSADAKLEEGEVRRKKFRIHDQDFDTKRELYERYVLDAERFVTLKRDLLSQLLPQL